MSDNLISEITLEFLMNKEQYAKHLSRKIPNNTLYKKDRRFYKRRIFDLTKQLLNNEKPERMYPDVSSAFDTYSTICIEYFKALDKSDIIQEDYHDFQDVEHLNNVSDIKDVSDFNNLMLKSINIIEPNILEKMVKRTSTRVIKKQQVVPQQKNINLKDPILKNKGICKKKNIINNYEDGIQEKKNNEIEKISKNEEFGKNEETNEETNEIWIKKE